MNWFQRLKMAYYLSRATFSIFWTILSKEAIPSMTTSWEDGGKTYTLESSLKIKDTEGARGTHFHLQV